MYVYKTAKLSLQSEPGLDGLPLYCLKRRGGNFIVEAVMGRSDLSMKSTVIPVQLRLVWVTPIWKRTDREFASEHRPISITNHCDYINIHNLISQDQHEGRSGRSTLTQLIDQHDTIMEDLANVDDLKFIYF